MMKVRPLLFLCLSALSTVFAGSVQAANPGGLAFKYTTNVPLYGKPTGLMIAGRCNRYSPVFATMRSKGGEVLAYINPSSRPDNYVCALDNTYYKNGNVPLWPWPSYGQRSIWPGTKMTDMRPGSAWMLYVVGYIEKLMRERKVDGVFLDTTGARPWGISNWKYWPQAEKDKWTDGCIDLVRRLDAKRRAINPNFIIINNNIWDRGDSRGLPGEKYVDGVSIEHPTLWLTKYHRNYVGHRFGNLGHRRVLIIARSAAEARAWAGVPGVTHVSNQMTYAYPTVPPVGFRLLNDR